AGGQPGLHRVAEAEVEAQQHAAGLRAEQLPDARLRLPSRAEVLGLRARPRASPRVPPRQPAAIACRPRRPAGGGRGPVGDDDQPEAQGVRTILPNCLPSARRRWASTPSRSGITVSTMARSRPAKSWPMTALNSASLDMVEPMIESCFQNTSR